jgi:glucose/arabinose dehydrogenase
MNRHRAHRATRAALAVLVLGITLTLGSGASESLPASAASQAAGWPQITVALHAAGLTQPVDIVHAGDASGRLFIVERVGRVRIIKNGALLPAPFLDISGKISTAGEQGLLGLAFPPGYAAKGRFYVSYTDKSGATVIARYFVSADPDVADPASEQIVLTAPHPRTYHYAGHIAFSPSDGYLYISIGDGGYANDPYGYGQNTNTMLGKILRIDVESGVQPYAIPATNPYAQTAGYRPEIWALGFRNPWRFAFDRATADLYIADVGQDLWEEVDFQPAAGPGGENYGWNVMEGTHCFMADTCDATGKTLPVWEYPHPAGCASITGGVVYRGARFPAMRGIYFYADYCSGEIWGLQRGDVDWQASLLLDTAYRITAFGEDEDGNVYLTNYYSGEIYRLADTSRFYVRLPVFAVEYTPQSSAESKVFPCAP